MKARLLSNAITTGLIARDYIRSVQGPEHSLHPRARLQAQAAHALLESFQDHDKYPAVEVAPPVRGLVAVLTEGLQGIPSLRREDGRVAAERLFNGCHVRLIGISERLFVVRDIFWDQEEVRIGETGRTTEYVVPWDCVELCEE